MRKITNRHFRLEDQIYHTHTEVIVGDWDYFHRYLKEKGIEKSVANKEWLAETGEIQNNEGVLENYYIRIPEIDLKPENYCIIVHELSHLTFNVLERAGVKFCADNQEPYAYLLEMFLKNFLNKVTRL